MSTTLATVLIASGFAAYLVIINLHTYRLFREDKARAMTGDWRIPESRLLLAAFLGGTPGGRLAMVRFRHKTRKQPFRGLMQAIGLFQYGLAVVGLFLLLSPSFSSYVAGVFADTLAPAPRIPAVETRGRVVVNRGLP
ncbi:MAG: DUF1294 domain-containing protein [Rhodobacter sp.]|nr:DUF1294 domain-containing protein [Paracoccaceae bacterium]MCC0076100.1 DUF1294 domain-containing protein [Rhodobacter sp.]